MSVTDAAPIVHITALTDLSEVGLGTTVNLSATITDAGANDTVGCTIDWGDGQVGTGSVANGKCQASHAYAAIGVPTILVTATDDDSATGTDQVSVVAGEPGADVHGGGWISPNGNRTSFGLVAKGGAAASGEVQVNGSKHQFHAHVVTNLVISGSKATWQGTGKFDGADGFTYTLSVEDRRNGNSKKGSPDTFSVEIRGPSGSVVCSASGPLQGGNIKVG